MRKSTKSSIRRAAKPRRKRTSRRRVSRRRVSRRRVSRRRVSRKLKFKMAPYDDDSNWDVWGRPRLDIAAATRVCAALHDSPTKEF